MIHHGDCLSILKEMPENSIDSLVTDPPYGWRFMGKFIGIEREAEYIAIAEKRIYHALPEFKKDMYRS